MNARGPLINGFRTNFLFPREAIRPEVTSLRGWELMPCVCVQHTHMHISSNRYFVKDRVSVEYWVRGGGKIRRVEKIKVEKENRIPFYQRTFSTLFISRIILSGPTLYCYRIAMQTVNLYVHFYTKVTVFIMLVSKYQYYNTSVVKSQIPYRMFIINNNLMTVM